MLSGFGTPCHSATWYHANMTTAFDTTPAQSGDTSRPAPVAAVDLRVFHEIVTAFPYDGSAGPSWDDVQAIDGRSRDRAGRLRTAYLADRAASGFPAPTDSKSTRPGRTLRSVPTQSTRPADPTPVPTQSTPTQSTRPADPTPVLTQSADPTRPTKAVRVLVWFSMIAGIAASLAANVAHADSHAGPMIASGWAPFALLLAVSVAERAPRASSRKFAALTYFGIFTVAAIAAVVSYGHQYDLLIRFGETRLSAALLPVSVDGLIVVASMALIAMKPPRGTK